MSRASKVRKAAYWLIPGLLAGGLCYGQESRATVLGRVTDPTGAVVPGANVRAINLATNSGASSVTNQSGSFEIPYLVPGMYRVTVTLAGFKTAVRDQIELRVNVRVRFMLMGVNALNHPQFGAPNTTPASSLFGTITSTASAREVHWGLKLVF